MASRETPSRIEPASLDEANAEILDLVADLSKESTRLASRLHPRSASHLADLVRVMNCYYSNLIEGHNTTPREIEQALGGDLDSSEHRRNLQIEARAHIRLQRQIDALHEAGSLPEPTSLEFILWLHRAFYEGASEAMLTVRAGSRQLRMTPGVLRSLHEEDVTVGRHIPPSSTVVADFMAYFGARYRHDNQGAGRMILAIPAAHHRFNFIHPFLDGNGRVSRLMSHAMGLQAGIGAHGLWSISRGLARGLQSRDEYKSMMDHADQPRQGDLDGRGNLSRRALTDFTSWFLKVSLDQVRFMSSLFELETLAARLQAYVNLRGWRSEAATLLEDALLRGELARGDAPRLLGLKERSARDLLSQLIDDGILGSETPKGPVSLRFPLHAADVLFPSLFP
jgi:Fic family protein